MNSKYFKHPEMTDCFLEIKNSAYDHDDRVFGRWWNQGTTKAYPCSEWEIIYMSREKRKEFKEYTPRNIQFIV